MDPRLVPLEKIAEIRVGVPTRNFSADSQGSPVPVISVRALTDTGIDKEQLAMVEGFGLADEEYRVKTNDLLLPARSTSVKGCVVKEDLVGIVFNATVISVRCHSELNPQLLRAFLLHPVGKEAIEAVSQSGTHQNNITTSGLARLQVPVPPIEVQNQIVTMLEAAEEAYITAVESAEIRLQVAREVAFKSMTKST